MKTICITNQKGGSGKTTFSALLIKWLSSMGKNVLAVDCDPQGGLTSLLHGEPDGNNNIFDLLMDEDVKPLQKELFSLYQADQRLDSIYATVQPFILQDLFNGLDYDFIIFDTPPTTQGISRAACLCADKAIIPADISRPTMRSTLYTVKALKNIKKKASVYLIGKDPGDKTGFTANLTREFMTALKGNFKGFIPRTVAIQKIVNGETKKPNYKFLEGII